MSQPDLERLGSDLVVYAARLVRATRRAVDQPTGTRVMSLLDEHGPLGVTQLADLDRCSQPTMSGTVHALLEQGWVRKEPHPDGARSSLVSLTPEGTRTLTEYRHRAGAAVTGRLPADGRHTSADLALAVAVLRDLLDTQSDDALAGTKGTL